MNRRNAVFAILALGAALPGLAHAQWSVSGDVENFRLRESIDPSIAERGVRYGVGARWLPPKDDGWLLGWKGRLYWGSVNYAGTTLFGNAPRQSSTGYVGAVNEFQTVYRPGGTRLSGLDVVASLGFDIWERRLSPRQKEDYAVAFLRLGVDYDTRAAGAWFAGGGVKLPIYVREKAQLQNIGFDQNPILHPRGNASVYAQLGYRFSPSWSLSGYYDGYRFGRSPARPATSGGASFTVTQPTTRIDTLGLRFTFTY